jgi:hypothetical protein
MGRLFRTLVRSLGFSQDLQIFAWLQDHWQDCLGLGRISRYLQGLQTIGRISRTLAGSPDIGRLFRTLVRSPGFLKPGSPDICRALRPLAGLPGLRQDNWIFAGTSDHWQVLSNI